jgi:hypothetical protein
VCEGRRGPGEDLRHPFEVGSHSVHLALVNTNTAIFKERFFGVVEIGRAIAIAVVGDFVIVPNRDPRKLLVGKK